MTEQLRVTKLTKDFVRKVDVFERVSNAFNNGTENRVVKAVSDVSFSIGQGEVVSLVGESGCGKSTIGKMLAGILQPTSGEIAYGGSVVSSEGSPLAKTALLPMQMIFQDPMSSLNPRKRIIDIICEAPIYYKLINARQREEYATEIFQKVGLDVSLLHRFPHQLSGGQNQRVAIARALSVKPDLLICDEATAALDVSIQAQIINLFSDLRAEMNLTYLFISHSLSVVEYISDRVIIMYLGKIVEEAPTRKIFGSPNHPYTRALLEDIPRLDRRKQSYASIQGEVPSPLNPPSGCHFHPRCPFAMEICSERTPELLNISDDHKSACHLNREVL